MCTQKVVGCASIGAVTVSSVSVGTVVRGVQHSDGSTTHDGLDLVCSSPIEEVAILVA